MHDTDHDGVVQYMNLQVATAGPLEVARRLFAAVERGDIETVAALYHSDAIIWHNYDRVETTREQNLEVLRAFVKRAPMRRYTHPKLIATEAGFVQQHVLEAVRVDGRRLSLPSCVVAEVTQGRIRRIDEYFDTAPLAGWYDIKG
jgi:ketosteroid isomerase-like protein